MVRRIDHSLLSIYCQPFVFLISYLPAAILFILSYNTKYIYVVGNFRGVIPSQVVHIITSLLLLVSRIDKSHVL